MYQKTAVTKLGQWGSVCPWQTCALAQQKNKKRLKRLHTRVKNNL